MKRFLILLLTLLLFFTSCSTEDPNKNDTESSTSSATAKQEASTTASATVIPNQTDSKNDGNDTSNDNSSPEPCKHVSVIDEAIEPTCTEVGKTEGKHCSKCNEILVEQTVIEKIDHTFVKWVIIDEPTSTKAGVIRLSCSACGEKKKDDPLKVAVGLKCIFNNDNTTYAVLHRGTCEETHLYIPETIDGHLITNIDVNSFDYDESITSLRLPGSLIRMSYGAFYECTNLTTIIYDGTMEEWNKILKGLHWHKNVPAKVIVCTDGEVALK